MSLVGENVDSVDVINLERTHGQSFAVRYYTLAKSSSNEMDRKCIVLRQSRHNKSVVKTAVVAM